MIDQFFGDIDQGTASFGQIGKSLLTDALPTEIVEAMDPRVSLEPLVFACFNTRNIEKYLPQIIFGYLPDAVRPERLSVSSNSDGVVCLPLWADFLTGRRNSTLTMVRQCNQFFLSEDAGEYVAFEREVCFAFGTIRLPIRCHPLTEALYASDLDCCHRSSLAAIAGQSTTIKALNILQTLSPEYWAALVACTREIVIFANPNKNSFAALSSYGTAFINLLGENSSVAFFLEDIIHQCGHIIFSSIDFGRKKFLSKSPDTPLSVETGIALENRTIHTALHGLFTEALVSSLLDRYLSFLSNDPIEAFECRGRLVFIMNKFGHDLQNMSNRQLYTLEGARLFECLKAIHGSIFGRRASEFRSVALGEQRYTFDATAFFKANSSIQ